MQWQMFDLFEFEFEFEFVGCFVIGPILIICGQQRSTKSGQ
jgi:uncharacterized membrane protein